MVRRDLRDPNGATWSDSEVTDLINSGVDWVNGIYPKESIQTTAFTQPVSGSVFSVALSDVSWVFRVDSSDSTTSNLDTTALNAVRVWAQAEAFSRLLSDRVAFQQWQVQSGNSDVSALSMNQIALSNQQRVRREETRLRKMRRLG